MKKNPILAAVLNFLTNGLGTVYVGRRMAVGLMFFVGLNLVQFAEISISPVTSHYQPSIWPFLLAGLVLAKLTLAVDAYREARAT